MTENHEIKYFIEDTDTHRWYRTTQHLEPTMHTFGKGYDKPSLMPWDYWTNDPLQALSFNIRWEAWQFIEAMQVKNNIEFENKNLDVTEHEFINSLKP